MSTANSRREISALSRSPKVLSVIYDSCLVLSLQDAIFKIYGSGIPSPSQLSYRLSGRTLRQELASRHQGDHRTSITRSIAKSKLRGMLLRVSGQFRGQCQFPGFRHAPQIELPG